MPVPIYGWSSDDEEEDADSGFESWVESSSDDNSDTETSQADEDMALASYMTELQYDLFWATNSTRLLQELGK